MIKQTKTLFTGKRIYSIALATGLALSTVGCATASPSVATAAKMDTTKTCSVEISGMEAVLATAKEYNAVAQKEGVEFRRLGVNNSAYIAAVEKALKDGTKTVQLINFKKKPTKDKFTVEYAAQRACKFAVSSLQLKAEAATQWRDAVPGDGYKY